MWINKLITSKIRAHDGKIPSADRLQPALLLHFLSQTENERLVNNNPFPSRPDSNSGKINFHQHEQRSDGSERGQLSVRSLSNMTSCWVWRSYRVCWCQTVTCASCLLPPENWYRSVYQGVNNKCIDKSADRITLFCSDPMTTTPGLDADPKIATWHNKKGLLVLWRINTLKWPASRAETHSASVQMCLFGWNIDQTLFTS